MVHQWFAEVGAQILTRKEWRVNKSHFPIFPKVNERLDLQLNIRRASLPRTATLGEYLRRVLRVGFG
jgi:hypothetical protein